MVAVLRLAHSTIAVCQQLLTDLERDDLLRHEATIRAGLETFVSVGMAFADIRTRRLYRETHKTFDSYCADTWGFSRQRAAQLINAGRVMQMITGDDAPANEAQARGLTALPDEVIAPVWRVIKETAPDGKVTGKHVASVARVFKEALETGAVDPGDGESIPLRGALAAAITVDTYEAALRQRQHIAERTNTERIGSGDIHITHIDTTGGRVTLELTPELFEQLKAAFINRKQLRAVFYQYAA